MRKAVLSLMVVLLSCAIGVGISGCGESTGKVATAADGLNLYAVASLIKSGRIQNAEGLQGMLSCGQGYNNLDLDNDGFCEDIQVTEYSNFATNGFGAVRGYSLTAHLHDTSVQEVARIEILNDARGVMLSIHGNEQIYGHGYILNSRLASNVSAVPFLVWAFTPTRTYGYVPHYVPGVIVVERRRVVPVTQYRQVTKTIVREVPVEVKKETKSAITSTVTSPNAGKTSTTIKAPLAAPTTVQQQFQKRPENKPVAVGGFGKPKTDQVAPSTPATPGAPKSPPQIGDKKALPAPVDKSAPTTIDQRFEKRDGDKAVTPGQFGRKPAEVVPTTPPAVAPTPPTATTVPKGLPTSPSATKEPPKALPTPPSAVREPPKAPPTIQQREVPRSLPAAPPSTPRQSSTPDPKPAAPARTK